MGGDETVANLKVIREDSEYKEYCENLSIDILKIFEFSSERGMMSVVVNYNDKIIVYSKGGDKKIKNLLSPKQPFEESILDKATKLSEKGLRVLLIGMKVIDESQFNEWNYNFEEGIRDLTSEEAIHEYKSINYKMIESGLTLIGCTAVEDKLQEKVPEVIKELQDGGINFWILTGDNLPTAKNIGKFLI